MHDIRGAELKRGDRGGGLLPMIGRFVTGTSTAQEFEREYLIAFKNDVDRWPESQFAQLDSLFADVDDYVADPALRAEVGGLDDDQLRDRARAVYESVGHNI